MFVTKINPKLQCVESKFSDDAPDCVAQGCNYVFHHMSSENCVGEVEEIKFTAVSHTLVRGGRRESRTCTAVKEICRVKA